MIHRSRAWLVLLLASLALAITGCASNDSQRVALPGYEWISTPHAIKMVNLRADSIDKFIASGTLTLVAPESATNARSTPKSVTYNMAMVVSGQNNLRLRAWQGKKPMMDITLNPKGLWIWSAPDTLPFTLSAQGIRQLTAIMRGQVPSTAKLIEEHPQYVTVGTQEYDSRFNVILMLHKATLTVRRIEFRDNTTHAIREAINLEDFDMIDMYPWPRQITASSDVSSLLMEIHDVQANISLPPDVFIPASVSVKQP